MAYPFTGNTTDARTYTPAVSINGTAKGTQATGTGRVAALQMVYDAHVEQIYKWDKQVRFGSGGEPAEAKPFTAARLADGARAIRDFWYTAWMRSATPLPMPERARQKKK